MAPPTTTTTTNGRRAPPSSRTKRKPDEHDPSISPPPTKRKPQSSSVSQSAMAHFFTPASQKPKDRVTWTERAPFADAPATLLVTQYEPIETKPQTTTTSPRVATFDLDSTLIKTASGKKHADGAGDWQWWHPSVPGKLRSLHEEGYHLVIFSNQGGLTLHPDPVKTAKAKAKAKAPPKKDRVPEFKHKCAAVLAALDLPVRLYAACGKDGFRKPRPGMWLEFCRDAGLAEGAIDKAGSFFVGDAAGRLGLVRDGKSVAAKDFACSDRNLAHNVGIAFATPEEYFLDAAPRAFARGFDLAAHPGPGDDTETDLLPAASGQEMVLFCGPPGAGKSSFFRTQLAPRGYARVNQDTLKSKEKCLKAATDFLKDGESVAIDNTNPDIATRAQWVALAQRHNVPIRCVWLRTDPAVCEHNDAVRALNPALNPEGREALPRIAFNGFNARFQEPKVKEGFAEVVEVAFRFRGTTDDYAIWGRYWL